MSKEAEIIAEVAKEFGRWFNDEVAVREDVPLGVIPELIARLYIRLRLHFEPEKAEHVMANVVRTVEHLIEEDALHMVVRGEDIPFRPAESFASDDERQFYIDASWGITEDDFDKLLNQ